MRFGSVCSGIEAASVAWHPLGWEAAWVAEVDVAASQVLTHRLGASAPVYPKDESSGKSATRLTWGDRLTNWGDFTRLPGLISTGSVEAPDVLCGGTPCQGFSVAGLRGGLEDPRGQLTLAFIQVADAIDVRRAEEGKEPCIIFWENVPGVRSDDGNAFGHFLAGLVGAPDPIEPGPRPEQGRSSAHWTWKKETRLHVPKWSSAGCAAGPRRSVAWRSCDAQFFALAQRRERVFVVASALEGFDPAAVLLEFDGLRRDTPPSREAGKGTTRGFEVGPSGGGFTDLSPTLDARCKDGPIRNQLGVGVGHFRPVLSTHCAEIAPTLNAHFGDKQGLEDQHINGGVDYSLPQVSMCLNAGGMGRIDAESETFIPMIGGVFDGAVSVALRGRDEGSTAELGDDVAFALRASGGGGDKPHVLAFSCKDYGADASVELSPTMRAMGHDGSHANAGGQIAVTHALRGEGFDASEDGTGRGTPIVPVYAIQERAICENPNAGPDGAGFRGDGAAYTLEARSVPQAVATQWAVRRLLPVECERLQGFTDGWTDVPVGKKRAADGPRYKQLGNSWAVPVVRWIGERIQREYDKRRVINLDDLW